LFQSIVKMTTNSRPWFGDSTGEADRCQAKYFILFLLLLPTPWSNRAVDENLPVPRLLRRNAEMQRVEQCGGPWSQRAPIFWIPLRRQTSSSVARGPDI